MDADVILQQAAGCSFCGVILYTGRPPVKSAFYVIDPAVARLIRIHAMLTAHSPLQVAMFEDREAAAKWLAVPVERFAIVE